MRYFSLTVNSLGVFSNVNRLAIFLLSTLSVGNHRAKNRKARNYIKLACWYFLFTGNLTYGADLGVVAATYAIKEQDFASTIQERLSAISDDEMAKHHRFIADKAKKSINRPSGINLSRATSYRRFVFDASITIKKDISHDGKVLIHKGTTANPLDFVSLSQHLVFFDSDDEKQLAWGIAQDGILILTNGAPLDVSESIGKQVYFDQGGKMVSKAGIEALPARISQVGQELIVEEILL